MSAMAIIAEDEAPQRAELVRMLAELWPELAIAAECEDGAKALSAIKSLKPDVAFLDIRMPQVSGIDVARAAGASTHIVFITAYDRFAVQAFEDGAADYLLKPVRRDRLKLAIERIQSRVNARVPADISAVLAALQEKLGPQQNRLRWITAGSGATVKLLPIEDVLFFQSQDKYTRVVTAKEEAHIRLSLKDLLAQLDPDEFWQVHRSAIVRVSAVRFVKRDEDGSHAVSIHGKAEQLPVSSAYVHRFRGM
jgi:DNA-binding LytR/AlgR family response regulator